MGLFSKFKAALAKTHDKLTHEIKRIVTRSPKLDAATLEEIEVALIGADLGLEMTTQIVAAVKKAYESQGTAGLDVLAIWAALAISSRRGRASEVVTLWPTALELKKIDARGGEETLSFAPADVRFLVDRDYNERVTGLWLKREDRKVPIGAFLSPDEKLSFSKVFGTALRKARA